ncbi:MAG: hypothetical protein CMO80_04865 [Verrucomicrobiales bacterium]|nr:hypothetical protein [Verrucomicrobiales bacterium]|tara:strand:+ start:9844 stop:10188 length:345 start_codon:yes stop_codon:yes gene_type:complete
MGSGSISRLIVTAGHVRIEGYLTPVTVKEEVRWQDGAGELMILPLVAHAGLPDLNRPQPRLELARRQMAIANDQSMPTFIALIPMLVQVVGDFGLDGLSHSHPQLPDISQRASC